ncbi:MAG: hypothetical protein KF791_09445 [Verrucomicrobiae bacterium]|nr:hypothetical protein [Verrucomicrobiae bacterium]
MNPSPDASANPGPGDDWLPELLRSRWPDLPLPPGFEGRVTYRIGLESREAGEGWLLRCLNWLWRPVPAAAVLGTALVIGGLTGWREGFRHRLAQEEVRYLASLDPTHHHYRVP